MSHLSQEILRQMKDKKMRAADLSRASGIKEPMLSRWLHDKQTYITGDDLERLCKALSWDKHEQAKLVRAHLLDECHGDAGSMIQIQIADQPELVMREEGGAPLSEDMQHAFEVLRANIADADVRAAIRGLARLIESLNKNG